MSEVATQPRAGALSRILADVGAPRFGEYWPGQGGILVAYRPGEGDQPDSLLIRGTEIGKQLIWGAYGTKINGADSHYDGRANTLALLESGHSHPAAEFAAKYTADGHTDFYMGSRRELQLIAAFGTFTYDEDWVWSSTQYSAYYAWGQYFDDGSTDYWNKDGKASALALRSFILQ